MVAGRSGWVMHLAVAQKPADVALALLAELSDQLKVIQRIHVHSDLVQNKDVFSVRLQETGEHQFGQHPDRPAISRQRQSQD